MTTIETIDSDLADIPVLREGLELHRTPEVGYILVQRRRSEIAGDGGRFTAGATDGDWSPQDTFRIEGYVLDYLAKVDGRTRRAELDTAFVDKYGQHFGPMLAERCWTWITRQPALVSLSSEPLEQVRPARLTGNDAAFYPMHSILEIIETCNFACDHCYYSSAPWKKGRLEYEDAVIIMDKLAANGVRIIEITGGECTIHPDFLPILRHAASKFELVAVLTNGWRVGTNEAFAAELSSIENVIFQVSIDAMGERHDTFRKHRKSFEMAVRAVERFVAAGRPVRIASSISEDALDDVVELVELGRRLNVTAHSFAPIASIGRGCNVTDAGAGSSHLVGRLNEELAKARHRDFTGEAVALPDATDVYEPNRNCGAGWRSFTVDYDGMVRACNFSRDSKKFGSVLHDDYQDIFGQQANFYFNNAPSPGGRDCEGCSYVANCRGCFVKAFMVSETVYPECPWRRRWFPNMPLSEEPKGGSLSVAEKRRKVPRFTVEDETNLCGSCGDGHAEALPLHNPDLATPVQEAAVATTFLGSSIPFGSG